MKALQLVKYGSAQDSFLTVDIPTPSFTEKEDVLIRVHSFGLNFADVMARKGLYKSSPPLPAVLGYEVVGEVIKVNNIKNKNLVGKRVLCLTRFGGYAEFVKSKDSSVKIIPENLSDGQALSMATQYCTAFLALNKCTDLKVSDTILIHSASGGVGTALTQLAKNKGLKVIGLTRSAHKVEYLTNIGVDVPIITSERDYFSQIKLNPELKKIKAIFNSVGGKTIKRDMGLLDVSGQLVFFGISDRSKYRRGFFFTIYQLLKIGKFHPVKLLLNSQTISGLNLLAIADKNPEQLNLAIEELISLFNVGKLVPFEGNEFKWDEVSKAHSGLEKGNFTGKVYIKVITK